MRRDEPWLTIGQMAELHYINKKTLLFYDQIGLFSPAEVGENGYRYYRYSQCQMLERILFLRRLEVPLEDIKAQLSSARAADSAAFLAEQRQRNLAHLRRLKEYDRVLQRKEAELRQALAATPGEILRRQLPPERYLVSEPRDNDREMSHFFSDLLAQVGTQHLYYYEFGAIVELERLLAGQTEPHRFFVRYRPEMKRARTLLRPGGDYLTCHCQDSPQARAAAYQSLQEAARQQHLRLCGDAFEHQRIDTFSTSDPSEYLVEITIPVTPEG